MSRLRHEWQGKEFVIWFVIFVFPSRLPYNALKKTNKHIFTIVCNGTPGLIGVDYVSITKKHLCCNRTHSEIQEHCPRKHYPPINKVAYDAISPKSAVTVRPSNTAPVTCWNCVSLCFVSHLWAISFNLLWSPWQSSSAAIILGPLRADLWLLGDCGRQRPPPQCDKCTHKNSSTFAVAFVV